MTTIEFKTKHGNFKDTFDFQSTYTNVLQQLRYERRYTDADIQPKSVKINGEHNSLYFDLEGMTKAINNEYKEKEQE